MTNCVFMSLRGYYIFSNQTKNLRVKLLLALVYDVELPNFDS